MKIKYKVQFFFSLLVLFCLFFVALVLVLSQGLSKGGGYVIIPPGLIILILSLGLLMQSLGKAPLDVDTRVPPDTIPLDQKTWSSVARALIVISLLGLYLGSLPFVGNMLSIYAAGRYKGPYNAVKPDDIDKKIDGIMLLGETMVNKVGEYGDEPRVIGSSWETLIYARYLNSKTDAPIIVASGNTDKKGKSYGEVVKSILADTFGIRDVILDAQTVTVTKDETKRLVAAVQNHNMKRVYLVTHSTHMPRTMYSIDGLEHGLHIIPAPVGASTYEDIWKETSFISFIPSWGAVQRVGEALHEIIGLIWYKLRA